VKAYADASALLRWLLKQPGGLDSWSEWARVVTSELHRVEAFRTLDRLRIERKLSPSEIAEKSTLLRATTPGFEVAPISTTVLQRACAPFPTVVGALDAIHLATALLWIEDNRESLVFLTHDQQLAVAAKACGLEVRG